MAVRNSRLCVEYAGRPRRPERFANDIATTLNGGINSSQLSLTVTSATGFPTTGTFRIEIDSEIILVVAVNGTTWTVLRGQEGTTAATHSNGATVLHPLTAGAVNAERSFDGIRPLPGAAGRLHFGNPFLGFDDGSAWHEHGRTCEFQVPLLADFPTSINSFASSANGPAGIYLTKARTAATEVSAILQPIKERPWAYEACITIHLFQLSVSTPRPAAGLCFREASADDWTIYGVRKTLNRGFLCRTNYSSQTTVTGTPAEIQCHQSFPLWLYVFDSGANEVAYQSFDGFRTWSTIYSRTMNSHATFDQVGFAIDSGDAGAGNVIGLTVHHFKVY